MKRFASVLGLLVLVLLAGRAFAAEPNWSKVQADLKKDFKTKGITFRKTGDFSTTHEVINGVKTQTGRQGVEVVKATKVPKVSSVTSGSAYYYFAGGKWSYQQFLVGDFWLEGMPDPDPKDLPLSADDEQFKSLSLWKQAVKIAKMGLADKPKFLWHDFKSVSSQGVAQYTALKEKDALLVDVKATFDVRWYRDKEEGPFTKLIVTGSKSEETGTKTISADEAQKMLTVWEQKFVDKRVKKEIPKFKSAEETCTYVYDLLMGQGTDDDVFWTLYWMIDLSYFIPFKPILNVQGEQFINEMVENRAKMKSQYPAKFQLTNTAKLADKTKHRLYFGRSDGKANGQCVLMKGKDNFILTDVELPVK